MNAIRAVIIAAALAATAGAQAQTATPDPSSTFGTYHPYVGISAVHFTGEGSHGFDPKLFAGVDFANNFGIEAGYLDYGHERSSYSYDSNTYEQKSKGYSTYLAGKYTFAINERFSIGTKLGVAYNHSDYRSLMNGATDYTWKGSDTGLYAGVGAQYKLNEKVSVLADYEHFGRGGSGAVSVGLKVGF